jgi:hypothetical protein
MGSDERIQGLNWLKPVSLLKAFVAGRGYLLWPEDLALAGNMQLVEASLEASGLNPEASAPNVTYAITRLHPNLLLLTFSLNWPQQACLSEQKGLHFWHAVVCNGPQSEASALAISDLGLSLLNYYESHYVEIGEALAQIAQAPTTSNMPNWSERFFRLPQQLPSTLNSHMRAMLADVRKTMPAVPAPAQTHLSPQRNLQWVAVSGWLLAGLLLSVLLMVALRG